MSYWILFVFCYMAASSLPFSASDLQAESSKPFMIALPIRIQASRNAFRTSHRGRDQDASEEEMQGEQRLVPRTYHPQMEPRFPQPDENANSNKDGNANVQNGFLTWNPGNKFMVLQINDFIGIKNEESAESEENDRAEEPPILTKARQNWGYQGNFDFEEAKAMGDPSNGGEEPRIPRPRSKKRKKSSANFSMEDTENGDVYGTDPVVHFLRNKNKKKHGPFDFGEMQGDNEDFGFKDWWGY